MGHFVYEDSRAIDLDDRALAHLQIVIIDKLRRHEAFALNLRSDAGMVTMWLNNSSALQFIYDGNRQPHINWPWVELLAGEASFRGILELLPEPIEILSDLKVAAPSPAEPELVK